SGIKPQSQTQSPKSTVSIPPISFVSNIGSPAHVDMERVRSAWALWYNDTRNILGLGAYTYDSRLNSTAYDWNTEFAKGKALNHHTRNPGDGYYNFAVIDKWFITRGVDPIVISRAKHTENVGYGRYSCSSGDCTESLIQSIRTTFDFFMSEKGKSYDAHYRSIVQPNFTKIGLSVIVVPGEQRYYLTVHYITK
ncbi:CAP domain-containing protein, partial [Candidatus Gracilibacteria bacterium]|nr:CAP domain-containing protein [Candidatus Gracilibacteria bacterium]